MQVTPCEMDFNKCIFDYIVKWVEYFLGANLVKGGEYNDVNYVVTVDDVDDPEVESLIRTINLNRGAVESIKMFSTTGFLKLLFNSKGSVVFIADDCEVLKFFKDTYNAKILSDIEYGAYHDLMHLPNIPMMHGMHINDNVRFMALDYCGLDGMEMFNRRLISYEMWKCVVFDLGECLDDIHALRRIHGDIKVENITWDGDQWYFVDFGLGYSGNATPGKKKICGTFPNILPAYGLPGSDHQVFKLSTYDRRRWSDYYAFALTMLSLAGMDLPGVDGNSKDYLINIYVERMYRIATEFHPPVPHMWNVPDVDEFYRILGVLVNVVLTQLDHQRQNLRWDPNKRTCMYTGENQAYIPCKYYGPTSMWEAWSEIYKLKVQLSK